MSTCDAGYKPNDDGVCVDVNECAGEAVFSCNTFGKTTCKNTLGSYICTCDEGFFTHGLYCLDVNECDDNPCHSLASCHNTAGSFYCSCASGYSGNGIDGCEDIDECADGSKCIDWHNASCKNTLGGHQVIWQMLFLLDWFFNSLRNNQCCKSLLKTSVELFTFLEFFR